MKHVRTAAAAIVALGLACAAAPASAQAIQSFTDPTVYASGGQDFSLGWEFSTTGETVYALGYNDYGFQQSHAVGIYDASQNLLASTTITGASTLINGYRYNAIGPLSLAAGNYFIVGVSGSSNDGWIYQANNIVTDASNTYIDSFFGWGGGLNFPFIPSFGQRQYLTASFFDTPLGGSAPEPATWAMMVSGFMISGLMLRRRVRPVTA